MTSDNVLTAIGLMAGTSLDGVDAAILRTDGEDRIEFGASLHIPYDGATRAAIIRATRAALEGRHDAKDILDADHLVTSAHIDAVRTLMQKARVIPAAVDVIGLHGQTILHRPKSLTGIQGYTWQIGSGKTLALECCVNVVDQFRQSDIANGGEGAPLAPVYHSALLRNRSEQGALAVLNIGGVANITYVPASRNPLHLLAFDCGPGNGMIDDWVNRHTGEAMDRDGAYAASGTVDDEAVALMALNPFIKRPPPKSLDRYDFKLGPVEPKSLADGAATLTAFTAECIARGAKLLPEKPLEWVVAGGGRHNPTLLNEIRQRLDSPVYVAEDKDWRGDMIEAECFAYLAVRSLKNLPLSYPGTTRVPGPQTGGQFHKGAA